MFRALSQAWVDGVDGPDVGATLRLALPLASAAASAVTLAAGRAAGRPGRALASDLASIAVTFAPLAMLSLAPLSRDGTGLLYVLAVAVRFAPAIALLVLGPTMRPLMLLAALAVYAALAAWLNVSSLPFGDQVHYLLATDRLAHGSLDAFLDASLFRSLVGFEPGPADVATHVAQAPVGPRTVQGYALPLLLLPGWIAAGRFGAELVVALAAAWTALQAFELVRETTADERRARMLWPLVAFLTPLLPLAIHVYPNAIGAALIATGYRFAFTRVPARPLLAGALLGGTLLLTPRDGLALLVLALVLAVLDRRHTKRFVVGAGAAALAAIALNAVAYGIPLPYAGYLFGTAQAQALEGQSSITIRFWIGLPAMLFDRTFGVAGSAPWLFIGVLGLVGALRARSSALAPAAILVGASLVALSFFRLWEGGYAPPNRYLVDVLPLLAPFVAYGIAAARPLLLRFLVASLVGLSAFATLVLAASPGRALNSAFDAKLQDALDRSLGVNPLGWLPNFQPLSDDWYVQAHPRAAIALLVTLALAWLGRHAIPARGAAETAPIRPSRPE